MQGIVRQRSDRGTCRTSRAQTACIGREYSRKSSRSLFRYVYCAFHKKIISSVPDKKAEKNVAPFSLNAQIRFNPFSLVNVPRTGQVVSFPTYRSFPFDQYSLFIPRGLFTERAERPDSIFPSFFFSLGRVILFRPLKNSRDSPPKGLTAYRSALRESSIYVRS